MYRVIKYFTDLKDNAHPYEVGDVFPRRGVFVTEERLTELSTDRNKRGCPLIEFVKGDTAEEPNEEPIPEDEPDADEAPKKRGVKRK